MHQLIGSITNYLYSEHNRTIDVIGISVITTFVTFILAKFSLSIWNIVKSTIVISIKGISLFLKKLYKKYIKQQLNLNEMIQLEKRLASDGKIKWYEKKSYKKYQETVPAQMQKLQQTIKEGRLNLKLNEQVLRQPTIPQIKVPDIKEHIKK